jgi:hypothetical protein
MSDSTSYESFFFTKAGIVIPMVTGSISFLSSSTIISIVLRSKSGIKTTYHRIMLGLSLADCLTSVMIALTTIPMPKDVIYPFEMPSYGNVATCEAQGLLYIIGNALCFAMNGILNIYYLCTLRFDMPEIAFRCYVEMPLYVLALVTSIAVPCATLLQQDMVNPSPTDPFCVPHTYPVDCTKAETPECRGETHGIGGQGALHPMYLATIIVAFFTLITTMSLIIHSFYRNERKLRKAVKDNQIEHKGEQDDKLQYLKEAQQTSGLITRQALMYIAVFVLTWTSGFVQVLLKESDATKLGDPGVFWFSVIRMFFQPLQGFFNLVIFVYHKVQTLRHADGNVTVAEALEKVFLLPDLMEDQATVSNLNMVIDEYVLGQRRQFEKKRAAAMNRLDCGRINLEDSANVGRGDFDEEVGSSSSVLESSSRPAPSVSTDVHQGPSAGMESRNNESNDVTANPPHVTGELIIESFGDDDDISYPGSRTLNDNLSGFSFSSLATSLGWAKRSEN